MSFLAQPFGMLLKLIYDLIGNYGISIIVFTVLTKLLLVPLTIKQTRSMKQMQELQPKLKELQEKYKNDKEKLNIKTMELYKEQNVSPFGGCLPLLIQFPIIIGLFAVLREPVQYGIAAEAIDVAFLWLPSLLTPDKSMVLPILAAITTYLSSATMSQNQTDQTQKMMTYMFPILIFWWGRSFPAGLTLYWVISNAFQVVQQLVIVKPYSKLKEGSN